MSRSLNLNLKVKGAFVLIILGGCMDARPDPKHKLSCMYQMSYAAYVAIAVPPPSKASSSRWADKVKLGTSNSPKRRSGMDAIFKEE